MDTVSMLRRAIEKSGLSVADYARVMLLREPRTVRRWLSGESPIPRSVEDFLREEAV